MTTDRKIFKLELPDNLSKKQLEELLKEVKEKIKAADTSTDIHITCVLDISGSMGSIRDDAIGGFNTFLKQQQDSKDGQAFLTLHLFDDRYETVYTNKPIHDVEPLTQATFVPRGSTALTDALGKTMNRLLTENHKNNIVVILTDGGENCSKEFTTEQVKKLTAKCEKLKYQFIYLGANQDSFSITQGYGMKHVFAANFAATGQGVRDGYLTASAFSNNTRSYMANKDIVPQDDELQKKV